VQKKAFIWAFGANKDGEIGVGSQRDQLQPRAIANHLEGGSARHIASGSHHTVVVSKSGDVYVCGSHLHGKLGLPSQGIIHLTKFTHLDLPVRAKSVACGDYHTLCLTEDGRVYAWGGTLHKKTGETSGMPKNEPRLVQTLADCGANIVDIDCGDFHSVALDSNGVLYSWGGGGQAYNRGQCGHGTTDEVELPQIVRALQGKPVRKVSAGGFHTLALTEDNELYAWGSGTYGELGSGDQASSATPKLVKMPNEATLVPSDQDPTANVLKYGSSKPQMSQISAGGHHSLVLTARGSLYSFGYGSHGQLGLRTTTNQLLPQLVKDLVNKPLNYIAAGWNHSLVLSQKGDIFATGYGAHGQLGLNDKDSRTAFQHVANIGAKNVYRIFAGGNHSWVVIDDIVPVRKRYRPPSPVADNKQMRIEGERQLRGSSSFGASGSQENLKKRGGSRSTSQPRGQQATSYGLKFKKQKSAERQSQERLPSAYGTSIKKADYDEIAEETMNFAQAQADNGTPGHMQSKKVVMMYDVEISLQASGGASDTQMCHRFVNFETLDS